MVWKATDMQSAGIETGVSIIDRGHVELISRVAGLRAAIRNQICKYTIDNSLAFLEEYVTIHFCAEEKYMAHCNYPGRAGHKDAHEQFKEELHFLQEELRNIRLSGRSGSYELSVETVQLVTDWITGHVRREDMDLGRFLRGQCNIDHKRVSDIFSL